MITVSELTKYLDDYLDVESIKDYCPNGLQVEGRAEIDKIVTGVSACMELFEAAAGKGAQAVVVHHGMFWDSDSRVVRGSMRRRLKYLLDHGISLIGYHLPLDRHRVVGNNIGIVKALGLTDPAPFGDYHGAPLGYIARTEAPVAIDSFADLARDRINNELTIHRFGPDEISSVAVCSGGCQDLLRDAILRKADLFITGEESEWIYHLCKEEGIHYIAAGHHATERFGPMALGDHLAEKFDVEVEFINIHNPI